MKKAVVRQNGMYEKLRFKNLRLVRLWVLSSAGDSSTQMSRD